MSKGISKNKIKKINEYWDCILTDNFEVQDMFLIDDVNKILSTKKDKSIWDATYPRFIKTINDMIKYKGFNSTADLIVNFLICFYYGLYQNTFVPYHAFVNIDGIKYDFILDEDNVNQMYAELNIDIDS